MTHQGKLSTHHFNSSNIVLTSCSQLRFLKDGFILKLICCFLYELIYTFPLYLPLQLLKIFRKFRIAYTRSKRYYLYFNITYFNICSFQGTDANLPKYLHSNERVRNRRLNKRDLLIMIKDVWTEKMENEGAHPFTKDRTNMADHLHTYLRKRFGVDAMVNEWGYNLHDAMTRYNFDSVVQQFQSILNGEVCCEI